ncbi:hypothetical protein ACOMHN_024009 [Nucella lapillus]
MLISDFEAAKSNSQPEDDILEALSEMEKQLVDNFIRLLMAAESGQMARFQRKALEDIQLDQDLEFHDSEIECDDVSEAEVEAPKSQTAETEGATHRGRSKQCKKAVKRSQEPSSDEEESVICKRPVNKGKDFLTVSQIDLMR